MSRALLLRGSRLLLQALEQIRIAGLEVLHYLEVLALDLGNVDLFDMHQTQELLDRPGDVAAALVAGSTALRDAEPGPELLLVHAELATDFAHVEFLRSFHA